MVADATPLNKIELLLKTIPCGLSQNTRTKTTQKQHTKQDKHTTHINTTRVSSTMVVILKGEQEMIKSYPTFE
jgi:hypothetical protein